MRSNNVGPVVDGNGRAGERAVQTIGGVRLMQNFTNERFA